MGKPRIDITNKKFGKWTVLEYVEKGNWLCECECGKKYVVNGTTLRNGKSIGCINCRDSAHPKNHINEKHNHWTILEYSGKSYWKCQCDCGTIKDVYYNDLKYGKSQSCGCIKSKGEEKIAKILTENNVLFTKQKIFSNCKFPDTQGLARFDFYVNNKYLIEYDGITHFEYKGCGWNNEKNFNKTQSHDEFKNQWCKENNMPLIRISYNELDNLCIEDLLLETTNFLV